MSQITRQTRLADRPSLRHALQVMKKSKLQREKVPYTTMQVIRFSIRICEVSLSGNDLESFWGTLPSSASYGIIISEGGRHMSKPDTPQTAE